MTTRGLAARDGEDRGRRSDLRAGGPGPDLDIALERYRNLAETYDRLTEWAAPYRKRAIEALGLTKGEVVVDVGCGTGLNFSALEGHIGAEGRVVGVDPCAAMLARAAERVHRANWDNVDLLCAAAEDARLPLQADAVLFCATHDVLRSRDGLANLLGQAATGALVVAAGPKWAPWWEPFAALNVWLWWANAPYVTSFEGFDCPWSHLSRLVSDLKVEQDLLGVYYLAQGRTTTAPDLR